MRPRLLNTRPLELLAETSLLIEELGFESVEFSGLGIEEIPAPRFASELELLSREGDVWVFTSPRGLQAIRNRLSVSQWGKCMSEVQIFPIGQKTKEKADELGAKNLVYLSAKDADDFARKLVPHCSGRRIFLFQGESAYPQLAEDLKALTTEFYHFLVYRVALREPSAECVERLSGLLRNRDISALIFGSSDTVRRTLQLLHALLPECESEFLKIPVGVIGQRTLVTARELGFDVHWIPPLPNFQGLLELMRGDLLAK